MWRETPIALASTPREVPASIATGRWPFPAVGLMVAEVSAARRRGATIEQAVTLVGDRYGTLAKTYDGGTEKIAAKHNEGSQPDNGSFDYLTCMILGMTGGG